MALLGLAGATGLMGGKALAKKKADPAQAPAPSTATSVAAPAPPPSATVGASSAAGFGLMAMMKQKRKASAGGATGLAASTQPRTPASTLPRTLIGGA